MEHAVIDGDSERLCSFCWPSGQPRWAGPPANSSSGKHRYVGPLSGHAAATSHPSPAGRERASFTVVPLDAEDVRRGELSDERADRTSSCQFRDPSTRGSAESTAQCPAEGRRSATPSRFPRLRSGKRRSARHLGHGFEKKAQHSLPYCFRVLLLTWCPCHTTQKGRRAAAVCSRGPGSQQCRWLPPGRSTSTAATVEGVKVDDFRRGPMAPEALRTYGSYEATPRV